MTSDMCIEYYDLHWLFELSASGRQPARWKWWTQAAPVDGVIEGYKRGRLA